MPLSVVISDQQDGTGISVLVESADPASITTAQIQDTSQPGQWRAAGSMTGNGLLLIPVGSGTGEVTFDRTYYVGVAVSLSGSPIYTGQSLITPTQGYNSFVFEMIRHVKEDLIVLNVQRINGSVFQCLDPRVLQTLPALPAVFVFQGNPEAITPADNRTSFVDVSISVWICDTLDGDWTTPVEWWTYARQTLLDFLHREATDRKYRTSSGRRWQVEPGPVLATGEAERAYQFRAGMITLHAQLERRIGGN